MACLHIFMDDIDMLKVSAFKFVAALSVNIVYMQLYVHVHCRLSWFSWNLLLAIHVVLYHPTCILFPLL